MPFYAQANDNSRNSSHWGKVAPKIRVTQNLTACAPVGDGLSGPVAVLIPS
jgi:hypothetical protein